MSQHHGAKRRKLLTRDKFYYVPILKTLKQLLEIQSIHNELLRTRQNNGNLLRDISDGIVFKNHNLFIANPQGLQIIAFYDEVETCNPLGSAAGKFKLGCIFFTLGNISPLFRSSLKSIFLVAVAKSSTIKVNGIDVILKPFLKDLKTLYNEGIVVKYAGTDEIWKGALLAFLADNLAAHELGGFKQSFSFARHFCRSCFANKTMTQSYFCEQSFTLRDAVSHQSQCSQLNGVNGHELSVEYGINRPSSLDTLPNFSVVENLPHDIMHDLLEGALPHELKLLLQHCMSMSYFNLSTLNERLAAFDIGYSEVKDKPALFGSDSKCKQTASQMWLLVSIFPLLIGDLIHRSSDNWACFLKLVKICEICTSPVISTDTATYLELLIEEHHEMFKLLYSSDAFIPKMHFMVHFGSQILKFGPLLQTWTMRHEAKLRIIKRAARLSNYKNVCQSVAKRHQKLLCYYIETNSLLKMEYKKGVSTRVVITSFPNRVQNLLQQQYDLVQNTCWSSLSFVTHNGITYKPDVFVMLSYDELDPKFAKVHAILTSERVEILFVLDIVNTDYYDGHFMAYSISENPSMFTLRTLTTLQYNSIFHARRTFARDNKVFINFKNHFEKI